MKPLKPKYDKLSEAVRKQRTQGATEYHEGVHFYYQDVIQNKDRTMTPVTNRAGVSNAPKMVFWTKKGVITLVFKLSEEDFYLGFMLIVKKRNPSLFKAIKEGETSKQTDDALDVALSFYDTSLQLAREINKLEDKIRRLKFKPSSNAPQRKKG